MLRQEVHPLLKSILLALSCGFDTMSVSSLLLRYSGNGTVHSHSVLFLALRTATADRLRSFLSFTSSHGSTRCPR